MEGGLKQTPGRKRGAQFEAGLSPTAKHAGISLIVDPAMDYRPSEDILPSTDAGPSTGIGPSMDAGPSTELSPSMAAGPSTDLSASMAAGPSTDLSASMDVGPPRDTEHVPGTSSAGAQPILSMHIGLACQLIS